MTEAKEKKFVIERNGQKYSTMAFSQQGAEQKIDLYLAQQEVQDQLSDEKEKSGIADALLSGLTNDEAYKTRWLAEKRFPNLLESGKDPLDYYFIDEDEDIAYVDPEDGRVKKEFAESVFGLDVADIFDKFGPTLQFTAELVPGAFGLGFGFLRGGIRGASALGGAGVFAGGSTAYAMREGTSALFDGPPLNTEKATKDLLISSAFGAVPIGVPDKSFGSFAEGIITRFPGSEGRSALKDIVETGGKTVDDKIKYAKDKYDVDLTRAEAQGLVTNASQIQLYLQTQPRADKLWQFYHNRSVQVEEAALDFFDELYKGTYVKTGAKNKLTGRETIDAPMDVAKAAEAFLEKTIAKRKARASAVYDDAFKLDVDLNVDDILAQVREVLENPNASAAKKKAYAEIEKALIDQTTGTARNTTELLHEGLSDNFNRLIAGLTKDADAGLKREVSIIRSEISNRLKVANPLYAKATAIYDPTKGHLQMLERSIVKTLAEAVEKGGSEAGRLTQKLFSGSVSPKEIKRLKRVLKQEDPQAWQNLKGTWLMTQFDDAVAGATSPLGVPNKFLSKLGIRNPRQAFPENMPARLKSRRMAQESVARGRKAKIYEAMFEPDELANFVDLADLMQSVSFIANRSQSPTQSLQAMQNLIQQEGKSVLTKTGGFLSALLTVPSRFIARGFDDIGENILLKQKEKYEDVLIEALINPNKAKELRAFFDKVNPKMYFYTQSFVRGGTEALENIFIENQARMDEAIRAEAESPSFGPLQEENEEIDIENLQSQLNDFEMPMVNQDLFQTEPSELTTMEMASPTILPDERDREIAMRRQAGIAGLV
jgi:hypothetical protein